MDMMKSLRLRKYQRHSYEQFFSASTILWKDETFTKELIQPLK